MLKPLARRVLRDEIEELEQDAFLRGMEIDLTIDNARSGAYMDGLREGQKGNAFSYAQGYQQGYDDQSGAYNEGWAAGLESANGENYVKGFDEGFEAGKSESSVPEDEAASLEECCESLEDDGFNEYDSGYGFGYDAGYEAAKQNNKELIDYAYALGVNDVAVTLRKALGAHTFALITHLLERSARG